jgi:hydroxymethylbilane synthase
MNPVRIATRGSDLALTQANYIAGRIRGELSRETELVVIRTSGDRIQNVSLAKLGGKGLFVKEIEEALLEDRADVAVHSAKDLPAEVAPGLVLSAFPQRVDPRDALVSREADLRLASLPTGARVGTGSTRRTALLLAARPDLTVVPLRGNVPTRIAKLETESLRAVVLACAGLERLGLTEHIAERISTDVMLPAVCQGILALETRDADPLSAEMARLGDSEVAVSAAAERGFLVRLGGDCTTPMAVHAELISPERLRVRGMVTSLDGRRLARAELETDRSQALAAGRELAETVLHEGGDAILEELRAQSEVAGS